MSRSPIDIHHLLTQLVSPYHPMKHLGFAQRVSTDYHYSYIPVLERVENRNLTAPPMPRQLVDAIKRHYREKYHVRTEARPDAFSLPPWRH
jgi:hypothetical protein